MLKYSSDQVQWWDKEKFTNEEMLLGIEEYIGVSQEKGRAFQTQNSMYKDMEAWNSLDISGTVTRLVWFRMEGRWAWRNEAGWMGGSQIMRSPIGYAEEPGIYSVTDKELLKVFNQGTGIVHFFFWYAQF